MIARVRPTIANAAAWLLVGALSALLVACFEPRYPEGIPCSEAQTCPPDQLCDLDGLCRRTPIATPADASPPQTPDARLPDLLDAQQPDAQQPDALPRCVSDAQCADGLTCNADGDCVAPTCEDGARNGSESDVDCGGTCPACAVGGRCELPADCETGRCEDFTCAAASCTDGVRNGDESDVDCGGSICGRCAEAGACEQAGDCLAGACVAGVCTSQTSCDELHAVSPGLPSGAYTIAPGAAPFAVFCDMLADHGWTLALKIDGAQTTFLFGAALWTDTNALGDATDLAALEAKSPSFWTVPVSEIRVLMTDAGIDRELRPSFASPLDGVATLRELFAGAFRPTTNARDAWLGVVASGSLQTNCQQQGLNNAVTGQSMRIGIFGNQEANCGSCDSILGIGHTTYASGNRATAAHDNSGAGGRDTRTFSYLFVR